MAEIAQKKGTPHELNNEHKSAHLLDPLFNIGRSGGRLQNIEWKRI
jgi:hypothetical protein